MSDIKRFFAIPEREWQEGSFLCMGHKMLAHDFPGGAPDSEYYDQLLAYAQEYNDFLYKKKETVEHFFFLWKGQMYRNKSASMKFRGHLHSITYDDLTALVCAATRTRVFPQLSKGWPHTKHISHTIPY